MRISCGWQNPLQGRALPARDLRCAAVLKRDHRLPKGVMLTHRNLVANVCQCTHAGADTTTEVEYTQGRAIAVLPFFHI
ncbi:MAG: AMP-binding protein [Solirubrobacteraceae bacterium]